MGEGRECVHLFAVEEYVQFDEVRGTETVHMPVEGRVALGDGLEFVVEVDDYLAKRHVEEQFHAVTADIFLFDEFASLAEA